jgi:hypothetical protein
MFTGDPTAWEEPQLRFSLANIPSDHNLQLRVAARVAASTHATMSQNMLNKETMDFEATPLLSKFSQQTSPTRQSSSSDQNGSQYTGGSNQNNNSPAWQWQYLVALCAISVVICYADRSNISTAVLPMAEQFNWDKVNCSLCT